MVKLSGATSPEMQIEPLDGYLKIDGDTAIYSMRPEQIWNPDSPFPPITLHKLGPVAPQLPSSLFLPFRHLSHQHAAKKCPQPSCVSISIKERDKKRKAASINQMP